MYRQIILIFQWVILLAFEICFGHWTFSPKNNNMSVICINCPGRHLFHFLKKGLQIIACLSQLVVVQILIYLVIAPSTFFNTIRIIWYQRNAFELWHINFFVSNMSMCPTDFMKELFHLPGYSDSRTQVKIIKIQNSI